MPLSEQQQAFGLALRQGADEGFLTRFADDPAVSARRFAAYRRNAWGNWRAALASTYPVIAELVGNASFRALADGYIESQPSHDGDLNAYGAGFAAWLAPHPISAQLPYLAAMAELEWALQCAYFAADPEPFELAALAAVPPERQGELVLRLWPAARLIESPYPLAEIWQAHQMAGEDKMAALARIDLTPGQHHALVLRHGPREVEAVAISPGAAMFWRTCQAEVPLGLALEHALAAEAALDIAALLPRWVEQRVITGFRLP
ncbi:MAG TPA: DNA-binding domain-containing protein [Rhodocyclaceae bacterium]